MLRRGRVAPEVRLELKVAFADDVRVVGDERSYRMRITRAREHHDGRRHPDRTPQLGTHRPERRRVQRIAQK
jgi:hypothetical protein